MLQNLPLNISKHDFFYRIVKGELKMRSQNPWVRPFLHYIKEHPKANEAEISRDLFADNGFARKTAVKNMLFFFTQNGLLEKNQNAYALTNEGLQTLEDSFLWKGKKGTFVFTFFKVAENQNPILLHIDEVPEIWYDNGKGDLVEMDETYGEHFSNLQLAQTNIKIEHIGESARETYLDFDYKAKIDIFSRNVKVKATSNVNGFENYEVKFKLPETIEFEINTDDDSDDDF